VAVSPARRGVYPVLLIDAIVLKIRDGQVRNRPIYVAMGISIDGERDVRRYQRTSSRSWRGLAQRISLRCSSSRRLRPDRLVETIVGNRGATWMWALTDTAGR